MLYEEEYDLKSEILSYRGSAFHQLGLSNQEVEDKIFQAPVLNAEEALKFG